MNLYEVEFTVTAIIAANSKAEAAIKADSEWTEIKSETSAGDTCVDIVRKIVSEKQLMHPWDGACFPYGAPAVDKRIKDYLK